MTLSSKHKNISLYMNEIKKVDTTQDKNVLELYSEWHRLMGKKLKQNLPLKEIQKHPEHAYILYGVRRYWVEMAKDNKSIAEQLGLSNYTPKMINELLLLSDID
jgi:hypothetical protein